MKMGKQFMEYGFREENLRINLKQKQANKTGETLVTRNFQIGNLLIVSY